jgi:hypothetical protein
MRYYVGTGRYRVEGVPMRDMEESEWRALPDKLKDAAKKLFTTKRPDDRAANDILDQLEPAQAAPAEQFTTEEQAAKSVKATAKAEKTESSNAVSGGKGGGG